MTHDNNPASPSAHHQPPTAANPIELDMRTDHTCADWLDVHGRSAAATLLRSPVQSRLSIDLSGRKTGKDLPNDRVAHNE
jgi:hypothetical protein